jgi:hypothetical protein
VYLPLANRGLDWELGVDLGRKRCFEKNKKGKDPKAPPRKICYEPAFREKVPAFGHFRTCPPLPLFILPDMHIHIYYILYIYIYLSVPVIRVGPPGYFIHISIATPIVPALKNYYR